LVGAGPPAGRNGDVKQPQVNGELAAMLIPVAQHDVAEELAARLDEDFASASYQTPGFSHCRIVKFWEQTANCGDALLEFVQYLLTIRGLGKIRKVGRRHRIVLYDSNSSSGDEREVVRKLSCRHGFFVWLPSQLVFRQAFQESARDGGLYFE